MIEKITPEHIIGLDGLPTTIMPDSAKLMRKINEIIDWINDVCALNVTNKQVTANLPNIDAGELAYLQKENSDLKDEVETLKKQLGIATEALNSVHYSLIKSDAPINTIYQMKDKAKEAISEIMELDND